MSLSLRAFANASRSAARVPAAQRAFSYTPFGPTPKAASSTTDAAAAAPEAVASAVEEVAQTGALSDAQAYVLTQPQSATYFRNIPLGAYPVAVPYNNEDAETFHGSN